MEIMTPFQVWEEYSPTNAPIDAVKIQENRYTFVAQKYDDGDLVIDIKVFSPAFESRKAILLVKDFYEYTTMEVIEDMVNKGYVVFVPDYSGHEENTLTVFPNSVEYGNIKLADKYKDYVYENALESSEYLYAMIIRRAITFINEVYNRNEIVLIGNNGGVDIAMQVAGMDKRLLSLVCLNGISYTEYLGINKYDDEPDLEISDDIMMRLTGVSGMAYAKYIDIPTLFAIGSNSVNADIDRAFNIIAELKTEDVRLMVSPRCVDNIDLDGYKTLLNWLENVFVYSMLPKMPTLEVTVNKEGGIYADIKVDAITRVESVKVYYACGNYDHTTRNWQEVTGEAIAVDEQIAKIEVTDINQPLFCFAQVKYINGTVLSSFVDYQELTDTNIKTVKNVYSPIVFQYSIKEGFFNEQFRSAVIFKPSLSVATIPVGLNGVVSKYGKLISFGIGAKKHIEASKLLQIDTYTELSGDERSRMLSVTLIKSGAKTVEYTALRELVESDAFTSNRFSFSDFHNKDLQPLDGWSDIKCIRIDTPNVVLNKILFI